MAPSQMSKKRSVVDLTEDADGNDKPQDTISKRAKTSNGLLTPGNSFYSSAASSQSTVDLTQDDDADAEVPSSNSFDDNAWQNMILYGTVETKIVGVRYYNGIATLGEYVFLAREPGNRYDVNAIRVDNVQGVQIGHIPRTIAKKLASFLDEGTLIAEGVLTGHKGPFDMPCDIKLFGTSDRDRRSQIKADMKAARLPTADLTKAERAEKQAEKDREKWKKQARQQMLKEAAASSQAVRGQGTQFDLDASNSDWQNSIQSGENGSSQPSFEDILDASVAYNPRQLGEYVDKYGANEENLSKLPMAAQPDALATQLLPYQKQGLAWMLDRENPVLPQQGSKDTVQLWRRNHHGFVNIATNFSETRPTLASGGILADDMGLGKTIQVISVIVAGKKHDDGPTLIICPLGVMSNWSTQINAHIKPDQALRVLIYHGANKTSQNAQELKKYDVVITSYDTAALEYLPARSKAAPAPLPRKTGLFSLTWRRVVLDEGHTIRNPKTKKARAACSLEAGSRWVLTGTPIVNNLTDLYSHVHFLRLTGGLENQQVFSSTLIRPLKSGNPEASMCLQALISTICLRRMKDMKFIDLRLPPLSSHKYDIKFLPHEQEKYEAFQAEAKGLLLRAQSKDATKSDGNVYTNLLEVLLRMRQVCNHWQLCSERVTNLLKDLEKNKTVALTQENVKGLRDLLQISIDSQEECPICFETLHNPVITSCSHVFGGECIERTIELQHKCPLCRQELKDKESVLVQPAAGGDGADGAEVDPDAPSSKVSALLDILRASRKKGDTKTVIFSQWVSFLDVVEGHLSQEGFQFCRLDGRMNAAARDQSMEALEQDPKCTIMLASLGVCSVGLNLVAANQVILCDSWWAPAIEDQAVDRVHRLGQKRPTTVFRLVIEGSIEERVLDIQQEKRKLMMTAFNEKVMKRGKENSARLQDIKKLLS